MSCPWLNCPWQLFDWSSNKKQNCLVVEQDWNVIYQHFQQNNMIVVPVTKICVDNFSTEAIIREITNLIGFFSCQLSHWDCQGNLCKKPFSTCISRREFLSFNLGLWDRNEISTIFENGIFACQKFLNFFLKMCLLS